MRNESSSNSVSKTEKTVTERALNGLVGGQRGSKSYSAKRVARSKTETWSHKMKSGNGTGLACI